VLRASRVAEANGVASFNIVSTGFMRQARAMATALGIPDVWVAEYPGVIPNDSNEVFRQKVCDHLVPSLLQGFQTPPRPPAAAAEPEPRTVVHSGTLDAVQDHFTRQLWTDGLPIVPPTIERIEAFLRHTSRQPDEIIGVLHPELREATVWSVAVNGVMAGCRPEYLPILLAAVEAVADPEFRLEDAGSTPGWEPLITLSGSLSQTLDFNTEAGALRIGRQANSSVGRFLRLFLRNVAGLRIAPGGTDKASLGLNFNVVLAESDDAVAALGWQPYRVDRGFAPEDNVVTVQSVLAISPPIYSGGNGPLDHIEMIAEIMATTCGPWSYTGAWFKRWHPLLVLSPSVAQAFAQAGWTKTTIQQYLFDHLTIEARWFERYPLHVTGAEVPLEQAFRERGISARYVESADPHRRVPLLQRPEWTGIVLAGDPGRNQCKVFVNNHDQGAPVSKRVDLP
jgi:hypothetical protein